MSLRYCTRHLQDPPREPYVLHYIIHRSFSSNFLVKKISGAKRSLKTYRTAARSRPRYHIQTIWPFWLVAATAIVLTYLELRMHTSVRATCPVPAAYKDTRVLAPANAIGSGVRAPCGDESVRSPPLICDQLLCVFRARKQQQSWCTCECACLCRYY